MKTTLLGLVLSLAAGTALAQPGRGAPSRRPAAAVITTCVPPAPTPSEGYGFVKEGRLAARECQVWALTSGMASGKLSFSEVSQRSAEIRRLYQARGRRQQSAADLASGGVFVGGTAWLAASGAGEYTLQYLSGATLLPLMVAQFNAFEPTSDLFQAGSLGLGMINARYANFQQAGEQLDAYMRRRPTIRWTGCSRLRSLYDGDGQTWPTGRTDSDVILKTAGQVLEACDRGLARQDAVLNFLAAWRGWNGLIANRYAEDVIELDQAMVQRDYDLRYGPSETLAGLLAVPFNLAGKLLTGEDGSKAVAAIKTQSAFANLNMDLAPIALPAVEDYSFTAVQISGALDQAAGKRDAAGPDQRQVTAMIGALKAAKDEIDAANDHRVYAGVLIKSVQAAAETTQLTFAYTPANRATQISLSAPRPPSAATVKTTTTP